MKVVSLGVSNEISDSAPAVKQPSLLTSSVTAIRSDPRRGFGLLILAEHRIAVSECIDLSPQFFDVRMIRCIAVYKPVNCCF